METKQLYDEYLITSMVAGFDPVEIDHALGTRIFAKDGKEYLDCFSGISVVNAGHGHPRIVRAAKEQMDKYIHCCTYVYYSPVAGKLAQRLAEVTPGKLKKTFFCNSGAEALEGAMRLAKHRTGKNEFIALTQSFHGRTYATLSITGNSARKSGAGPYMPGVAFAPAPYFYRCPFRSKTEEECGERAALALLEVIKYHTANNVAAFIAEPVMGEGGIIVPPPNYFKLVKQILDDQKILFIADEVQSGFGRTGKLFAIEHYGVEPDIMCMAKGIAGGFPLGAFIARPEVADSFTPGSHLSTFGGSPVSCAAALANLDVFAEEKLVQNSENRGAFILGALQELEPELKLVGNVRGKGLMMGIELVKDAEKTPAVNETKAVKTKFREKGLLVGVGGSLGNVIRLQPPLTISEEEARRIVQTVSMVLREVNKTI
jgi:4-aminobutyrate aminotransferase